jgi:hypothetical protein
LDRAGEVNQRSVESPSKLNVAGCRYRRHAATVPRARRLPADRRRDRDRLAPP